MLQQHAVQVALGELGCLCVEIRRIACTTYRETEGGILHRKVSGRYKRTVFLYHTWYLVRTRPLLSCCDDTRYLVPGRLVSTAFYSERHSQRHGSAPTRDHTAALEKIGVANVRPSDRGGAARSVWWRAPRGGRIWSRVCSVQQQQYKIYRYLVNKYRVPAFLEVWATGDRPQGFRNKQNYFPISSRSRSRFQSEEYRMIDY